MADVGSQRPRRRRFRVDPSMAEAAKDAVQGSEFFRNERTAAAERNLYAAPPPPPVAEPETRSGAASFAEHHPDEPEKPKVQPREVARKAVTEIKKTPPKLFVYSIAGALASHSAGCGHDRLPHSFGKFGGRKLGEQPPARGGSRSRSQPKPAWNAAQPPVSRTPAHAPAGTDCGSAEQRRRFL